MASPILNGYFQYTTSNGNPLSGGTIGFYFPGTTTPKPIWKDRAKTLPSPNPLTLDSTGRAQLYGFGVYRQIVRSSSNQLIWDGEATCVSEDLFPLAIEIAGLDIGVDLTTFKTSGFAVPGKGAASYVRLAAAPPANELAAGLGRWLFQSNGNLVWWRLAEEEPSDYMFGVIADAVVAYTAGLMTVTGTDDTAALQAAVNFALYYNPTGRKLRLPSGKRRITDTIHIGYGDRYLDWILEGDRRRSGTGGSEYLSGIYAMFNDRPAFNIQSARRSIVRQLALVGPNHAWLTANYNSITDRAPRANWRGPQARNDNTDQYAPSCGVAIDGYSGVRQVSSQYPDVAYPSWTGLTSQYNRATSSQVQFDGVSINGFQAGVAVQPNLMPTGSNGDFIRWDECDLSWNEIGVSISHSDARVISFEQTIFHFCHTKFDSLTFGSKQGNVAASFEDCSFDNCYQALNVNLGITAQLFTPTIVYRNAYCEAVNRLGVVRPVDALPSFAGSVRFIGGELAFFCKSGETTPASYLDGRGEVTASFEGTCIRSTFGVFAIDCEIAEFRASFPTIAFSPFEATTAGGRRAITALACLFAPRYRGPVSLRAQHGYGYNNVFKSNLAVDSHGWSILADPSFVTGSPVPLFVRSTGAGDLEQPIGQAPQHVLDRAIYPLTGVSQTTLDWTFTCSLAFLTDPNRPSYSLGAGDIVRDEDSRLLYYIKAIAFTGSGASGTATMTVRQVTGVYTANGTTWTSSGTLAPDAGKLRFYCSRRIVAGKTRRLLLQTTAGSAEADLICPGSEAGADGQLNTAAAPVLAAGDYLLASSTDSYSEEQSLFPSARIVTINAVTGHVQFDTPARRTATVTSPLFIKAV